MKTSEMYFYWFFLYPFKSVFIDVLFDVLFSLGDKFLNLQCNACI